MKKRYLLLALFVFVLFASCDLAGNYENAVTVTLDPAGANPPGYVFFSPATKTATVGTGTWMRIMVTTGTTTLGCYGLNINYPANLLQVDTSIIGLNPNQYSNGYRSIAMPNMNQTNPPWHSGFAVNSSIPGIVRIGAYKAEGTTPSTAGDIILGYIYFIPIASGTANITFTVNTVADKNGIPVANPLPAPGTGTITIQ